MSLLQLAKWQVDKMTFYLRKGSPLLARRLRPEDQVLLAEANDADQVTISLNFFSPFLQ
jgi:hypothetical protein